VTEDDEEVSLLKQRIIKMEAEASQREKEARTAIEAKD
jgi:hypothetical protein